MDLKKKEATVIVNDTKKVFKKLGACSSTFYYLLNREFGYLKEEDERASNPFAGGIMQKGHQCGMLWGSALAVGAESYRRCSNHDQAVGLAIHATQHLIVSFSKRTKSVNCREITDTDFSSKFAMLKYMLFKARYCFNLSEKWAPEAIQSATEGLSLELSDVPGTATSCATEVVKKMGASDEKAVTVAGFAGGLGLSGNACGALSAAIWMKTLAWNREHSKKSSFSNPDATKTFNAFEEVTDSEILCHKISGKRFKSIDDHTEFIKNGGCERLITVLSQT